MPAITATAPGKIILFGEHAVVYGRPAIAVPVTQVQAKVIITFEPTAAPGAVRLVSADTGLDCHLNDLPADHPLAMAVTLTAARLGIPRFPALRLMINSTIPIAAGLGSGAAVTAAMVRALSAAVGHTLNNEQISQIAFQVDQKYHGTPSGIDNNVIAYAQPIYFVRGQPLQPLRAGQPFTIVIGNTGVASPTGAVVGDVRRRWQAEPDHYELLFNQIGEIAAQARVAIETGAIPALGNLMTRNHALLQSLDVSSAALDRLVETALASDASGAKLCGGGRGGNMIALVSPETAQDVSAALLGAGAVSTITTTVR